MTENKTNFFADLSLVNVSDKVEQKNGLSYLSWAWAWAEVCKRYPDVTYEVIKFNGVPYIYDPNTGYMVYTTVTIEGITREMWLPVMDGNNKAMKSEPYEITTKWGKKITVEAATMFDINKTIMRCLTKNLAVATGLGLYIYAGDDLPEGDTKSDETKAPETPKAEPKTTTAKPSSVRKDLVDFCNENGIDIKVVAKMFKLNNSATDEAFLKALDYCKAEVKKKVYAEARAQGKVEETTVAEDVLAEAEQFLEGIEEV